MKWKRSKDRSLGNTNNFKRQNDKEVSVKESKNFGEPGEIIFPKGTSGQQY